MKRQLHFSGFVTDQEPFLEEWWLKYSSKRQFESRLKGGFRILNCRMERGIKAQYGSTSEVCKNTYISAMRWKCGVFWLVLIEALLIVTTSVSSYACVLLACIILSLWPSYVCTARG